MIFSRRMFGLCAGAALVASSLPGSALAAGTKSIAYYGVDDGTSTAFLIDWMPKSVARLVGSRGAQTGTVSNDGTQKVITYASPLTIIIDSFDDCGEAIQLRDDNTQTVVRDHAGGVTEFVQIGTETNIGGCHDGLSVPYGSLTEAGTNLHRLAMTARPPISDLVPGTEIAGFSDDMLLPTDYAVAQDVVTMKAAGVKFHTSGSTVHFAIDANQWMVFDLPFGQRAYTRLEVDAKNQGETWLMADWAGGQPIRVEKVTMVKPTTGAGFGTVAQASRMWESGIFAASRMPFFIYLFKNGTGDRVKKDLDLGTESHVPIDAWEFVGTQIRQRRVYDDITRERSWMPLSNVGKFRWVMESEVDHGPDGTTVLIKPRVNYYLDTGKAVPPVGGVQRSRGFVSMHAEPRIAR